jgi:hypothetical protein
MPSDQERFWPPRPLDDADAPVEHFSTIGPLAEVEGARVLAGAAHHSNPKVRAGVRMAVMGVIVVAFLAVVIGLIVGLT